MSMKFHVFYLEDQSRDRKLVRQMFPSIRKRLLEFFRHSFPQSDGAGPDIQIVLVTMNSVQELADKLVENGMPTEMGRSCLFFILDFYILERRDDDETKELPASTVAGVPFYDWLSRMFAAVPKLVLTKGGRDDIEVGDLSCACCENKSILENPDEFADRIAQLAGEWWEPTFSLRLAEYSRSGENAWHTPGHNGGNAFIRSEFQRGFYEFYSAAIFKTDLSVSVEHLGDLSEPDKPSPLRTAQRRAADVFGAKETFFITNGTSSSNKAMLMTLLKPGDLVLVDRNCHKSVHHAVVMAGALPIYLPSSYNSRFGVWAPVPLDVLESAIRAEWPDANKPRMLMLTTCSYEGILYPVADIVAMCEFAGMLFYADEAWAPHLRFHPHYVHAEHNGLQSFSALDGGAHFVVQSTHKILAAFSQASMIHVSKSFVDRLMSGAPQWEWLAKRFSRDEHASYLSFRHHLLETLRYWHSTSPHYPMIATLERAGIQLRLEGMHLLHERIRWANEYTQKFNRICTDAQGCVLGMEDIVGQDALKHYPGYEKDPLKLVLTARSKHAAKMFTEKLHEMHIQYEKYSETCVEFLITIGTFENHLERLLEAVQQCKDLLGMPAESRDSERERAVARLEVVVRPCDAVGSNVELASLDGAVSRICAQLVVPYPPGIPILVPGAAIREAHVELIKELSKEGSESVHGIVDKDGQYYVEVMTMHAAERAMNTEESKLLKRSRVLAGLA